mgnify:CR=1 FL=1
MLIPGAVPGEKREKMEEMQRQTTKRKAETRRKALNIIRNANRAAQQAAMALAYLDAESQSIEDLAGDALQAALHDLEAAINLGVRQ